MAITKWIRAVIYIKDVIIKKNNCVEMTLIIFFDQG